MSCFSIIWSLLKYDLKPSKKCFFLDTRFEPPARCRPLGYPIYFGD